MNLADLRQTLPVVTSNGRHNLQWVNATGQNPTTTTQQADELIESRDWIGRLLPQPGQQQVSESMPG